MSRPPDIAFASPGDLAQHRLRRRVSFDAPFSHAYLDPVAHVTFTTLRPAGGVGDAGPADVAAPLPAASSSCATRT